MMADEAEEWLKGASNVQGFTLAPPPPVHRIILVMRLLDDTWTASTACNVTEDPYGNIVRSHGPLADENPFRFSTKYFDDETGLGYWGMRWYSTERGRWLNRDPIAERGGLNLYAYVGNEPVGRWDLLGRHEFAAGDTLTDGNGEETDTIIVGELFTEKQKEKSRKAMCLARKILNRTTLDYAPLSDIRFATMWDSEILTLAITVVHRAIAVSGSSGDGGIIFDSGPAAHIVVNVDIYPHDSDLRLTRMASYGATLLHEAMHYYGEMAETNVYAATTDAMKTPFDAKKVEGVEGCCFNGGRPWPLRTTLGLYACECGIDLYPDGPDSTEIWGISDVKQW